MDELPPTVRERGTGNDREREHERRKQCVEIGHDELLRAIVGSYAACATTGPPQRLAYGSFAGASSTFRHDPAARRVPRIPAAVILSESDSSTEPTSTVRENSMRTFRAMLGNSEAQGLVEYALIIALVSIVAIAALRFLGSKSSNTLRNAGSNLAY